MDWQSLADELEVSPKEEKKADNPPAADEPQEQE